MKKTLIILFILLGIKINAQEVHINLKSITSHGVTDTVDAAPILIDINNRVVISGNERINGTQYDASTAQQLSNGVMTWTQSFNLSTQKAWVLAQTTDLSGNIFVTGGVATGTTNGIDLFCIKYTSAGSPAWTYTYNGQNSTMDVGTAITVDTFGDVYICGASDGTLTSLVDFVTMKLNGSTGALAWPTEKRYNYANGYDVPTGIAVAPFIGGNVIVSGTSGNNFTDWDFASVEYNSITGAVMNATRTPNPGSGQDKVFGMSTDTLGNVYVTGTMANLSGGYDIQTSKLDTGLNVVWTRTLDINGMDDAGINVAVDDSMNVYVVGSAYYSGTNRNLVLVKYDGNGNLQWKKQKRPPTAGSSAEGVRVKVKNTNEIFVGGNFTSGGNQDLALLRYNRSGELKMEKQYNGSANGTDKFMDFTLRADSNIIFVSARTYSTGNLDQNIVLKYVYEDFPNTGASGGDTMKYLNNQAIIGFHPLVIKMPTINDKEKTFGTLDEFVSDSTCNKINGALGGSATFSQKFKTRKIFPEMTAADSLSTTRSGNTIKVPKFYCNLLVEIPEAFSLTNAVNQIKLIKPDIYSTELNCLIKLSSANDPLFTTNQHSLRTSTVYPNANINVDSCWAVTAGIPNIKVGVYDSGVEFDHPDLQGINWGGYDFVNNTNISPFPGQYVDNANHGTPIAGIIGARRNDNTGIAGIAGGKLDSSQIGASIYDMRIMNNGVNYGSISLLANAYKKGHTGTTENGFGLNITNHSYYVGYNSVNYYKSPLLQDQVTFANRNGVAFVASKANVVVINAAPPAFAVWPSDWNPEIVSCVAMSGNNGNNCNAQLNTQCSINGTYGHNLDFVAPGSASVIMTTTHSFGYQQPQGWDGFDGCSAAAPHVAGSMALMMSYWNSPTPAWDNLVHEDCEWLLRQNCTDLTNGTYSETVGYDAVSGQGRINAYASLRKINKANYRIRHIDEIHYSSSVTKVTSLKYSNYQQYWPAYQSMNYTPMYIPAPINAGTYSTEVYEVETTINYTINPTEGIVGYWPLYKESVGWSDDTVASNVSVDKPYFTKIISVTPTSAKLKTWVWRNLNTGNYYPCTPALSRSNFVLYTYDTLGTGVSIKEEKINPASFNVYPNPSNGEFNLSFNTEYSNSLYNYRIFDILGKEIKREDFVTSFGKNTVSINFRASYGVYLLKVYDGNKVVYTQKLIKSE